MSGEPPNHDAERGDAEEGDERQQRPVYERPVLLRLGDLRQLTAGAGPGSSDSPFSGQNPPGGS